MKDSITIQRIALLHPSIQSEVMAIYDEICSALSGTAICRFTHTLRTFKEQNDLYAKGRTLPGQKVTNAKGGESYHNYGLAIDFVIINNGQAVWSRGEDFDGDKIPDWMEVVKIFKKYGWKWGGDFKSIKDYPHVEKSFGYSTKQLNALPKIKGIYPIL
jgi:peptidoglycan L-alanyl-D-glutamate endopeptidase CwlK